MSKTLNVTSLLPLHTITREAELEDTFCCLFFPSLNRSVILFGIW